MEIPPFAPYSHALEQSADGRGCEESIQNRDAAPPQCRNYGNRINARGAASVRRRAASPSCEPFPTPQHGPARGGRVCVASSAPPTWSRDSSLLRNGRRTPGRHWGHRRCRAGSCSRRTSSSPGRMVRIARMKTRLFSVARLAIRIAGMIDVAGLVSAHAGIDHRPCIHGEQKRVVVVRALVLVALIRLSMTHAVARVLDDGGAFADAAQGKYTVSMNGGMAHLEQGSTAGRGFSSYGDGALMAE